MTKPPSAFAGVEDLVDLGQGSEIDMRPTLLRVLTDLYVQRPAHTPEDERYYTELASRLMDAADAAARARLAQRLASYPSAPRALIARLARDSIEVAAPILRHSTCLDEADLAALAVELGGQHAEIIEQRRSALVPPARVQSSPAHEGGTEAAELSELFYAAGAAERRLILLSLDYAPIPAIPPSAFVQRSDTWRLEAAALRHNTEVLVRELLRILGISRAQARRVLWDDSGEPMLAAAKAMDLPADVLQRMLLFMNPRVGQSVDRIYELTKLYHETTVAAARRLVAILREADKDAAGRHLARGGQGCSLKGSSPSGGLAGGRGKRAQGAVGALSTAHELAGAEAARSSVRGRCRCVERGLQFTRRPGRGSGGRHDPPPLRSRRPDRSAIRVRVALPPWLRTPVARSSML
jgi:hypothetical protein